MEFSGSKISYTFPLSVPVLQRKGRSACARCLPVPGTGDRRSAPLVWPTCRSGQLEIDPTGKCHWEIITLAQTYLAPIPAATARCLWALRRALRCSLAAKIWFPPSLACS